MKRLFLSAAGALALAACSNEAVVNDPDASPASGAVLVDDGTAVDPAIANPASDAVIQPTDAATYLAMAAAGDKWEIESSQVLLKKSQRPDVRAFAQMMVDQHQQSTERLKAAAAKVKATMPVPTLAVDQQGMLSEIRTAAAEDVDGVYLRHQRAAHAMALAMHQGYAQNGDTPELRAAASAIAKVVAQHMAELDRIARAVPSAGG